MAKIFDQVWKVVLKLDPDHSDARVGLKKGQRLIYHRYCCFILCFIFKYAPLKTGRGEGEGKCSIQSWQLWEGAWPLHKGGRQHQNPLSEILTNPLSEIPTIAGPDHRLDPQVHISQTALQQSHSPFKVRYIHLSTPPTSFLPILTWKQKMGFFLHGKHNSNFLASTCSNHPP